MQFIIILFLNRLLFAYCYLTKEIPDKVIEGFPQSEQNALWRLLERLEFFIKKDDGFALLLLLLTKL